MYIPIQHQLLWYIYFGDYFTALICMDCKGMVSHILTQTV